MFRPLHGYQILPNSLTGQHTVGATFTEDITPDTAAPTLVVDMDGSVPFIISRSIPLQVAGNTTDYDITPPRNCIITKTWLQKTGTGNVLSTDTVSIFQLEVPLGTALVVFTLGTAPADVNGGILEGTTNIPESMMFGPAVPIRIRVVAGAAPTDTQCIVYMLCQRVGGA